MGTGVRSRFVLSIVGGLQVPEGLCCHRALVRSTAEARCIIGMNAYLRGTSIYLPIAAPSTWCADYGVLRNAGDAPMESRYTQRRIWYCLRMRTGHVILYDDVNMLGVERTDLVVMGPSAAESVESPMHGNLVALPKLYRVFATSPMPSGLACPEPWILCYFPVEDTFLLAVPEVDHASIRERHAHAMSTELAVMAAMAVGADYFLTERVVLVAPVVLDFLRVQF